MSVALMTAYPELLPEALPRTKAQLEPEAKIVIFRKGEPARFANLDIPSGPTPPGVACM